MIFPAVTHKKTLRTPRDFFAHKHPKLLAKVLICQPRYATRINCLKTQQSLSGVLTAREKLCKNKNEHVYGNHSTRNTRFQRPGTPSSAWKCPEAGKSWEAGTDGRSQSHPTKLGIPGEKPNNSQLPTPTLDCAGSHPF